MIYIHISYFFVNSIFKYVRNMSVSYRPFTIEVQKNKYQD